MIKKLVRRKVKRAKPVPMMEPGTYTAREVLCWVRDRIKEEPKRLRMSRWVSVWKGRAVIQKNRRSIFRPFTEIFSSKKALPQCQTVACMAGWINIGLRHPERNLEGHPERNLEDGGRSRFDAGDRAILGLRLTKPDTYGYYPYGSLAQQLNALFHETQLQPDEVVAKIDAMLDPELNSAEIATELNTRVRVRAQER